MAKCYNCGKNFDYDKYYGICPKCSAYNREKLPEEEHEMLHAAYDPGAECRNLQETRPRSSGAGIAVLVLLIIGIVATIAVPVIYIVGKSMSLGMHVAGDAIGLAEDWEEDDWASLDESVADNSWQEYEHPRQNVEVTTASVGERCLLGSEEEISVTVTGQAYVMVPAGQVEDFPQNENLVGIPVSYGDQTTEYRDYNALSLLYAGFGQEEQIYRQVLSSYDLEEYMDQIPVSEIMDSYLPYGSVEAVILVFVPREYTNLSLYLESRDEDNNQMLGLYEIPLEIQAGEVY